MIPKLKVREEKESCNDFYSIVDEETGGTLFYEEVEGLERAKLFAAAPETKQQRDDLLEVCKKAQEELYQKCAGKCPFCGEPDFPVCGDKKGYGNVLPEDAEEWQLDHLPDCIVTLLDNAVAKAEKD